MLDRPGVTLAAKRCAVEYSVSSVPMFQTILSFTGRIKLVWSPHLGGPRFPPSTQNRANKVSIDGTTLEQQHEGWLFSCRRRTAAMYVGVVLH